MRIEKLLLRLRLLLRLLLTLADVGLAHVAAAAEPRGDRGHHVAPGDVTLLGARRRCTHDGSNDVRVVDDVQGGHGVRVLAHVGCRELPLRLGLGRVHVLLLQVGRPVVRHLVRVRHQLTRA